MTGRLARASFGFSSCDVGVLQQSPKPCNVVFVCQGRMMALYKKRPVFCSHVFHIRSTNFFSKLN